MDIAVGRSNEERHFTEQSLFPPTEFNPSP